MSWRKIKAEYIAGGISQRALAEKYDVPMSSLVKHAKKEKWTTKRKDAENKAVEKVAEKKAEIVADNAVLLEKIKTGLLQKLSAMVDAFPVDKAGNAVEYKERTGTKNSYTERVYRMKDIAAVYAALEDKTTRTTVDIEDLSPLVELLRNE